MGVSSIRDQFWCLRKQSLAFGVRPTEWKDLRETQCIAINGGRPIFRHEEILHPRQQLKRSQRGEAFRSLVEFVPQRISGSL
uniref:hypothetical protein n=1 Tax=Rhizobium rhizogenes TaxID=359 RepID=UPI0019111C66|nr:hypothetical protein [Rhizobium rhizogenes]